MSYDVVESISSFSWSSNNLSSFHLHVQCALKVYLHDLHENQRSFPKIKLEHAQHPFKVSYSHWVMIGHLTSFAATATAQSTSLATRPNNYTSTVMYFSGWLGWSTALTFCRRALFLCWSVSSKQQRTNQCHKTTAVIPSDDKTTALNHENVITVLFSHQ